MNNKSLHTLFRVAVCLAAALIAAAGIAVAQERPAEQDVVTVTARGEGISADGARLDALRQALERGGRQEIASRSEVRDFELIRDTIYARADGVVSDYRVLREEKDAGGLYTCEIEAKVSRTAIASTWGEVQNVLDQIGRPKIAVYIVERIDGQVTDGSVLESRIEEQLLKRGFTVYSRQQLEEIAAREIADAQAEENVNKLLAMAKRFDTQILIAGVANADQAGITDYAGARMAMYNCDALAKMYYTDTGELIASETLPQTRRGARSEYGYSPQAARRALSESGERLVEQVYQTCMRQWATRISAGGTIELEVQGLNMARANQLKQMLEAVEQVQSVHFEFAKGIASYRVQAKMASSSFLDLLVTEPWSEMLEVVEYKQNRIHATSVKRDG